MTVAKLVERAGTGAGVGGRHFPHRWRHSYATSLLRRGVDIHVVQRLMGHANIATTTRYLHLSDADLSDVGGQGVPRRVSYSPTASRDRRRAGFERHQVGPVRLAEQRLVEVIERGRLFQLPTPSGA